MEAVGNGRRLSPGGLLQTDHRKNVRYGHARHVPCPGAARRRYGCPRHHQDCTLELVSRLQRSDLDDATLQNTHLGENGYKIILRHLGYQDEHPQPPESTHQFSSSESVEHSK